MGVGESIAGPATVAPTAPNLPQPQAVPQENAVPRGADGGAGMQRIDPADEAVLGRPVVDPRSAGAPGERDPDWDGLDDAFDADPASDAEEGGAPSDDGADHDPDEKPGDGS